MTLEEEKQAQRRQGIAARRALTDAERAAANGALCAALEALPVWQKAKTILAYAACGGEADLSALLEAAARAGKEIAFTVVADGDVGLPVPNRKGNLPDGFVAPYFLGFRVGKGGDSCLYALLTA